MEAYKYNLLNFDQFYIAINNNEIIIKNTEEIQSLGVSTDDNFFKKVLEITQLKIFYYLNLITVVLCNIRIGRN